MQQIPVSVSITALADRIGIPEFVRVCSELMAGADRNDFVEELRSLTGHSWNPGDNLFDSGSWPGYWLRTWGARGLLYVWDDRATEAVVAGLADEHWRPAEMCLKVATRHEVVATGDGAASLVTHDLPRVRLHALRALAVVGDTPHVGLVQAAMRDPRPDVRRHAARALGQMRERLDIAPRRHFPV